VPITILTPQTGDAFGPGFFWQAQTDLIGPLAFDAVWTVTLTVPADEGIVTQYQLPSTEHMVQAILTNGTNAFVVMSFARPEWTTGAAGQFKVELDSSSTSFHEEETVAIVLDRETGATAELARWIEANVIGEGMGLTDEEHDAVVATQAAVVTTMGIPGDSPAFGLADFLVHPPLFIGGLSTPPYVLEGDGELPDLHTAGHARFGLYWLATTIPPGLSHVHGNTEEYTNRLVQFRTTHVVGGVELVTEVFDAHWHGGMWRWETALPTAIDYSVLPGVVVEVRYWQYPAV